MPELIIDDLSGGISDEHPSKVGPNQVEVAYNVDFWDGKVAGRRNGSTLVVSGLSDPLIGLFGHTPTTDPDDDRLWCVSTTGDWQYRDAAYVKTDITPSPADDFFPIEGTTAASLHGKLFIACRTEDSGGNPVRRLHVWDGTNLRRCGLEAPSAAPTASNTGVGSLSTTTRYYRVRAVQQVSSVVVRRSEPSPELTFTPSGTGSAVRVTRPTLPGEGETHWEVEESINAADWYRIASVVVATSTYDDSLATEAVATTGILSADIGDYLNLPSAEFVVVDNDRLVYGGNYEDSEFSARVGWTPVSGATGVGNDERAPLDLGSYIDVDGLNSGRITDMIAWEGKLVVFKANSIHTLVRTGSRTSAYIPGLVLSRKHGALKYSAVEGLGPDNSSALYFLDPELGPSSYGSGGLTVPVTPQLLKQWKTITQTASIRVCHAVYHAEKRQVWWHVCVGETDIPNQRWVLDTASGGVSFHTFTDTTFYSSVIWKGKPHVGVFAGIVKCDDPAATTDAGTNYRAYIRTRAYQLGGLLRKADVSYGVLEADVTDSATITLKFIRDYGRESRSITLSLTKTASDPDDFVIRPLDNAYMTELLAVQFEIGDAAAVDVGAWQIHRLAFAWTLGGRAA